MTKITQSLLDQQVWDYRTTPTEFDQMLNQTTTPTLTRDQRWAMSRLLERADYYTAVGLIGSDHLKQNWPVLRPLIRAPKLRKPMITWLQDKLHEFSSKSILRASF